MMQDCMVVYCLKHLFEFELLDLDESELILGSIEEFVLKYVLYHHQSGYNWSGFTWFGFQVSSNILMIWLWTISSLFQTFFKTTRIALRMRPSLSNTVRVMSSMSSGSGHDNVWVIQPLIHWLKHILLWEIFELTKIPLVPTLVGLKFKISFKISGAWFEKTGPSLKIGGYLAVRLHCNIYYEGHYEQSFYIHIIVWR